MVSISRFFSVILAVTVVGIAGVKAQSVNAALDMYSFFDNSEGDDSYRNTMTHAASRFTPKLIVATDDGIHSVTGGYSGILEYGTRDVGKGDVELYYQYKKEHLRALFGSFPRTLMHEQMPEYLICDSIRYYRPEMTGFDFLYTTESGHFEAFCDWTQKRSSKDREQFMAGIATRFRLPLSMQIGIEGYLYHYALEEGALSANHFIHETLMAHPYVGFLVDNNERDLHADFRIGALVQGDHDRSVTRWSVAAGFIGDADVRYRRFSLHETVYAGKRQQPDGNVGFGLYYWGDTFLQSPWYSRTDLSYCIAAHKSVQFDTKVIFNFAEHGMQWHQLLTLRYNFNVRLK